MYSFGIWLFYGFQFLGELRGGSPLLITAQFSPSCVSGLAAALTTGFLLSRIPPGFIMMISMMAFCIGNILFATMPVGQTYWIQAFLSSVVTPWGMDMSFPCATILLSNLVPKRNQGIAASLVATVVNYSISIGLGIGGTVETHVNDGGKDLLRGYRGAWYSGIGLAACGVLMSFYFIYHNITEKAKAVKAKIHEQQEKRRSKRASQLHA
jgi:MFS family permease